MSGLPTALPPDLAARLGTVRSVGVITGAGVSAESGIRPYRGPGGLYDDPEEGERTVEALSGATLRVDPDRTWRTLARLARQAAGARPGPAHLAIVAIERKVERFVLLTQNVDGLHRLAGSRNVIEIHGNLYRARCPGCGDLRRIPGQLLAEVERAPRCGRCGGTLRPDAVLFGELLPPGEVRRITDELHRRPPDLVLVAGTSALFPYITEPVEIARRLGRLTVEIDPEPTPLDRVVDFALRGTAGALLPLVERALPPRPGLAPRRPRDPLGRPLPRTSDDEMPWREEPERVAARGGRVLARAVELFDQERFFETHEFFEYLWKSPRTAVADRGLWRGLAQLAVGCCHLQRGNAAGAARLLERAAANLEGYADRHAGLDVAELTRLARTLAGHVRDRGVAAAGFPRFPRPVPDPW